MKEGENKQRKIKKEMTRGKRKKKNHKKRKKKKERRKKERKKEMADSKSTTSYSSGLHFSVIQDRSEKGTLICSKKL